MTNWRTLFGKHRSKQANSTAAQDSTEHLLDMDGIPSMAGGAPLPFVVADEQNASLFYCTQTCDPDWDGTTVRMVDAASEGEPAAVIRFNRVLWHRLGPPNEEAIGAHPLCRLGLHPYTAKEVVGSKMLSRFCRANRIHQYHSDSMFEGYRHFAIAFHDSVFEAISYGYSSEVIGKVPVLSAAAAELKKWKS